MGGGNAVTATEQALETARVAVAAAADKKAHDIVVLDVSEQLVITDCFVIASAPNERQVEAIVDAVEIGAGPEQRALRGELSAQLRDLLDTLPEKQREILVLRIVVGLSAEETAQIVGASPGSVRVAQHRALSRLRKNLPPDLGTAPA